MGIQKVWASVYWTKIFYYLYISKRYLPGVFVWADCASVFIV